MPSLAARKKDALSQALRLASDERPSFIRAQFLSDRAVGDELVTILDRYEHAARTNPGWTSETTFGDPGPNTPSPITTPKSDSISTLFTVGRKFGPYQVVGVLKPGGMGEVALADDARLRRQVVLKCLAGRWLASPLARQRLMREARASAALNHPNIATLYDVLEDTEEPMLVMEYVEGRSLRDVLHDGPLPVGLALRYAIQITDAVSYAHDRGIVHCDIKPSNVQITPAHVAKVLDFGLARAQFDAADELSASEMGKVMGTPGYMPPERLVEGTINVAGDVYGIGVVLFEMLTNRPPYIETGPQLMLSVLATDAPRPSLIVSSLPSQLDAVVTRALARNADLRYRSARELMRDLLDALTAIEGRPWSGQSALVTRPTSAIDWRRLALAGVAAFVAVVFAGFATTTIYLAPLGINEGFENESVWTWPKWGLMTMTAPVVFMAILAVGCLLVAFLGRLAWTQVRPIRRACDPLVTRMQSLLSRVNAAPTLMLAPLLLVVQVGALALYVWRFREVIGGLDSLFTQQPPGSLEALRPGNHLEHNGLGQWLSVQLLMFGAAWYQLLKRRWTRHDRDATTIMFAGVAVLAMSFLFFQVIPFRILYHNEAERVLYRSQPCYLVGRRTDDALLFCPTRPLPWKQIVKINDPALEREGTFESIFAAFDSRN